jgi:hypothetical protein
VVYEISTGHDKTNKEASLIKGCPPSTWFESLI